jgi:hypothetical protein
MQPAASQKLRQSINCGFLTKRIDDGQRIFSRFLCELFLVLGLFNFASKILFVVLHNGKRHTPRIINALKTDVHRNHKQQTVRSHTINTIVLVNYEDQPLYVIEEKSVFILRRNEYSLEENASS